MPSIGAKHIRMRANQVTYKITTIQISTISTIVVKWRKEGSERATVFGCYEKSVWSSSKAIFWSRKYGDVAIVISEAFFINAFVFSIVSSICMCPIFGSRKSRSISNKKWESGNKKLEDNNEDSDLIWMQSEIYHVCRAGLMKLPTLQTWLV